LANIRSCEAPHYAVFSKPPVTSSLFGPHILLSTLQKLHNLATISVSKHAREVYRCHEFTGNLKELHRILHTREQTHPMNAEQEHGTDYTNGSSDFLDTEELVMITSLVSQLTYILKTVTSCIIVSGGPEKLFHHVLS
jgi:hypothetical protein